MRGVAALAAASLVAGCTSLAGRAPQAAPLELLQRHEWTGEDAQSVAAALGVRDVGRIAEGRRWIDHSGRVRSVTFYEVPRPGPGGLCAVPISSAVLDDEQAFRTRYDARLDRTWRWTAAPPSTGRLWLASDEPRRDLERWCSRVARPSRGFYAADAGEAGEAVSRLRRLRALARSRSSPLAVECRAPCLDARLALRSLRPSRLSGVVRDVCRREWPDPGRPCWRLNFHDAAGRMPGLAPVDAPNPIRGLEISDAEPTRARVTYYGSM